jgi:flagellum-specific ATP synthase
VIALVGERGRELREFTERVLGPRAWRAASVVITATSDQSPLMRRRCACRRWRWPSISATRGCMCCCWSIRVTRFAEAHREVALAAGGKRRPACAAIRPRPPMRSWRWPNGPGRAPGGGRHHGGLFGAGGGSDMEEPVADILRGTLDGHVVLDRKIAERGRYPAIDLLRSVSRSLPEAASAEPKTR